MSFSLDENQGHWGAMGHSGLTGIRGNPPLPRADAGRGQHDPCFVFFLQVPEYSSSDWHMEG